MREKCQIDSMSIGMAPGLAQGEKKSRGEWGLRPGGLQEKIEFSSRRAALACDARPLCTLRRDRWDSPDFPVFLHRHWGGADFENVPAFAQGRGPPRPLQLH